MKFKTKIKECLGLIRAKKFNINFAQGVYIGKQCRLIGKKNITLEDNVIIRPYTQIWSGGGYY